MKRLWRFVAWIAGVAVVVALVTPFLTTSLLNKPKDAKTAGGHGHGHGRHGGGADGPTPVLTAPSRMADVPVYVEGVGTGQALNSVLIRTQVDGTLMSLNFTEGQQVKAGDTIAKIDPRLYQATLDSDVAKKQLDEATLANNIRDLDRYKQLTATKAVTQQQYDTQVATVAQTKAQIAIDQAMIDSARTTLGYTDVISPIAGRTGIRKVDVGNLLHASDTTGIVTVSQIQPISIIFNVPQQDLPRINKASLLNQLDVQALDTTGRDAVDHGVLAVVDNTIDQTTGTVKLKANFDNKELQLWPGIFTNVRLKVQTLKDAIIIPVGALQRGPKGPFVFTVVDNKARMVLVSVGQQDDNDAVIDSGLKAGETLITSGFAKLTDGAKVAPATDPAEAAKAKAPAAIHQGGVSPATDTTAGPPQVPRHRGGARQRQSSAGE